MRTAKLCFCVALLCVASLFAVPVLGDLPKVKDAAVRPVIRVDSGGKLQVLTLRQFKVALAEGEPAGATFAGRWCEPRGVLAWTTNNFGNLNPRAVKTFREELTKVGYKVAGDPNELFSDSSTVKVDLEVGGLVTDLVVTHCQQSASEALGGAFLKVKWQVYSPSAKAVVFQVITEGSSQNLDKPDLYRPSDRLINAFRMATDNLLAEQGFRDLVVGNATPQESAAPTAPRYILTRLQVPPGGLAKNVEALRGSVATVYSMAGTGSGFFIGTDGYLITNQHVVGDSRYVKVKLLTGRELVGEVLISKQIRDVALIKTEPLEGTALSVRDSEPGIGAEVYALGSPFGETFQGTITKGVLSGYREIEGIRYLQSDVTVLPGNSGGPLLDEAGAVVGMARLRGGAVGGNLNLFIPIGEALNELGIQFK